MATCEGLFRQRLLEPQLFVQEKYVTPKSLVGAIVAYSLLLASCSGGGDSPTAAPVVQIPNPSPPPESQRPPAPQPPPAPGPDPEPIQEPKLPLQLPARANGSPIVDLGDRFHIGTDVAPQANHLSSIGYHHDIQVSHGILRDGVGAQQVLAYLEADTLLFDNESFTEGYLRRFGEAPPTVRVAQGTTPEQLIQTVRAVQFINAALPHDWQLEFSSTPGPAGIHRPSDGDILVEFAAHEDWPHPDPPANLAGLASTWSRSILSSNNQKPTNTIVAAHLWIDHERTSENHRLTVLVHELIHALGRDHPDPNRFPDSIMVNPATSDHGVPGHILYPLDREALLAVYGRIEPATNQPEAIAENLGPWEDSSTHVRGGLPDMDAAFGVAWRNGLAQPWAYGPVPDTNLTDNPVLFGIVRWDGRLLGFTPSVAAVGGAAQLSVDLETLNGQLDFTVLESWAANARPGAIGTGTIWGDGELRYTIGVRGNAFIQTGGDDGVVTGAFFGASHESMGGVLERVDLNAAFGALRE